MVLFPEGGGGGTSLYEPNGDVPLNGVAFSIELLECSGSFSDFGVRMFFMLMVSKCTKMLVL